MPETTNNIKDENFIRTLITFTPEQWAWLKSLRKTRGQMASGYIRNLVEKAMIEEGAKPN